jgi:DNA-directed RNA polymerase subunit RPC12/RpoP
MGIRAGETLDQWLDREERQRYEEASIKCPYCRHVYYEPGGDTEDMQDLITYWGAEDGPVEVECSECEKTFLVKEDVERTYEVMKPEEDDANPS